MATNRSDHPDDKSDDETDCPCDDCPPGCPCC
jgi:hypothetical protein